MKSKPGKLFPLQCDLTSDTEIMKCMEWIEKNMGCVDVLINNAAICINTTTLDCTMEEWKKTFDVNVIGLSRITKEIVKLMKKKGKTIFYYYP